MNTNRTVLLCLALLFTALVGCTAFPQPIQTPAPSPSPTPSIIPTETELPPFETPEPLTLTIWVPPQFDPESDTPAGDIFQERLEEFSNLKPDLRIEVRVKALQGSGGLLSSLTTAHTAAPKALPDLVLLRYTDLEPAAIKGLLTPLDELSTALDETDWYTYARQLALVQENIFGLPFVGDALVLIYRPSQVSEPPPSFEAALRLEDPLSFPAASSDAFFPLALYLATDGRIQDEERRPTLDSTKLTTVLTFFQDGAQNGVLPLWLTQLETFDQSTLAYRENQAQLAITWASKYLEDPPIDTVAAPIPTSAGNPFTLADGWIWALSSPHEDRHELTVELAEFLTTSEFLGTWTSAAGYLPTRASALEGWPPSPLRSLVDLVVLSAQVIPETELITIVSPALREATLAVLKDQVDPAAAARTAASQVTSP